MIEKKRTKKKMNKNKKRRRKSGFVWGETSNKHY